MHRLAARLRLEIPQGAIERVSRGPCGHRVLQLLPGQTVTHRGAHRLERGRNARDRLAIARIGDALASARMCAVAHFRHYDLGFSFRAARDRERTGNQPAFGANSEGKTHARRDA
jgi:hypothetical protein